MVLPNFVLVCISAGGHLPQWLKDRQTPSKKLSSWLAYADRTKKKQKTMNPGVLFGALALVLVAAKADDQATRSRTHTLTIRTDTNEWSGSSNTLTVNIYSSACGGGVCKTVRVSGLSEIR
ncbi:hypothetical protein Bbelb_018130 [Branchiostoma belcheri]|nr:hypothetical protein Bbelb_018130 [Branchiostoma belcheri]